MITRAYNPETDYDTVRKWWEGHHATIIPPSVFLPGDGLIIEDVAVSWLFITPNVNGGVALIEFTTSNPEASDLDIGNGIRLIIEGLEALAEERGCGSIMGFAVQNSGMERLLASNGYQNLFSQPHHLYGRIL